MQGIRPHQAPTRSTKCSRSATAASWKCRTASRETRRFATPSRAPDPGRSNALLAEPLRDVEDRHPATLDRREARCTPIFALATTAIGATLTTPRPDPLAGGQVKPARK